MDKRIYEDFPNPDYPVVVRFEEIKKTDNQKSDWIERPKDFEIIVVNTGGMQIFCEDGMHNVSVGNGALLTSGCRHRIVYSPYEDTTYYSVVFDSSFTGDVSENNDLGRRYFAPTITMLKNTCILMEETKLLDERALEIVNSIIVENTVKKFGYEILTKGHMCMLWGILLEFLGARATKKKSDSVLTKDELRVKDAISFMKERYSDLIGLTDIADRVNISRNECCRCFKRVLDTTPIEFLMRLRVFEAAKKLYKDSKRVHTISELAFDTGFNNASYFIKIFKRYFGCSPLEFTKMLKEDPDKARLLYENLSESLIVNL